MKRKALLLCIFISLPFFVTSLFAETDIKGWENVKWGMKHSQVKKLYGLTDWAENDPPRCFFLKKIEIANLKFGGNFTFDEKSQSAKLNKIVFARADAGNNDLGIYKNVINYLTTEFGKSDKIEEGKKGLIIRWNRPSGSIKLELTDLVGETFCFINFTAVRPNAKKNMIIILEKIKANSHEKVLFEDYSNLILTAKQQIDILTDTESDTEFVDTVKSAYFQYDLSKECLKAIRKLESKGIKAVSFRNDMHKYWKGAALNIEQAKAMIE